jgi:hypothetical protein
MAEKRSQAWNFWLKGAALVAQRAIGLLLIAATLPVAGLAFQEGACLDSEDGAGIKLEVPDTVSSAPASILISPVHRFNGRAELDVMILKGSTNVWEINILLANLTEPFEVKWDLRETPSGRQAAPGLYRVVARAVDLTDGSSFCNEATFELARQR